MRTAFIFLSSILGMCLIAPLSVSQQPSAPGWDLGIDYPQEDEDEPFKLNNGGSVIISFFVSNDELLPITKFHLRESLMDQNQKPSGREITNHSH